jgi:hypothetical protein
MASVPQRRLSKPCCHAPRKRRRKCRWQRTRLAEFPGVGHLFDNPATPKGHKRVNIQTTRSCDVREGLPGMLVNAVTARSRSWNFLHGAMVTTPSEPPWN